MTARASGRILWRSRRVSARWPSCSSARRGGSTMPIPLSSRYYGPPVYDAADDTGLTHPTVAIRLSGPTSAASVYQHILTAGETVEYLAWRYYGSSAAWWRIADANAL